MGFLSCASIGMTISYEIEGVRQSIARNWSVWMGDLGNARVWGFKVKI